MNRLPKGSPAGGQFAAGPRSEAPGVGLRPASPCREDTESDADALDAIATCLGEDESWDGAADYLEDVAARVGATGRPHPGHADRETYGALLGIWQDEHPGSGTDYDTLNKIARHLGAEPDWSSEDLETVSDLVARSGRAHPGDGELTGEAYREAIKARRDPATRAGRLRNLDPETVWENVISGSVPEHLRDVAAGLRSGRVTVEHLRAALYSQQPAEVEADADAAWAGQLAEDDALGVFDAHCAAVAGQALRIAEEADECPVWDDGVDVTELGAARVDWVLRRAGWGPSDPDGDPQATAAAVLADVRHWADRNGADLYKALNSGYDRYLQDRDRPYL